MPRVRGIEWRAGAQEIVEIEGARVELLGLRHAGDRFVLVFEQPTGC